MVYEYRTPVDFSFGVLTNAAAVSDTVISSADFASLPSAATTSVYLPLVLLNPATKTHEKVWVTAHAAGATTLTVVRGRENTAAQAWPAGTQWVCAPTARDGLYPVTTRSALPADAHVGMRCLIVDEAAVVERSSTQGWVSNGAWTSYTPAWTTSGTQPSLGNGALTGEWARVGNLVFVRVSLTWGSSTSGGTNAWGFSLPITAAYTTAHNPWPLYGGAAIMRDVSAFNYYAGTATIDSSGSTIGGIYSSGQIAATSPFTFAAGDHLSLSAIYRAA
ncbi:hypothetical protein [Labedaea rhizosphaerae]|uniref:Uncharacterized protein n=1 Tax=Labedaea rhizosphaerae TaxID=598644 RepID=A0A4R6SI29_LABRH|nr:hypothetical protein [Labedaea rhizosphaerae]TDQ01240.1 hypothetical protein EV186_1021108 [Labedaea rhizosphaerae]